MRIIILTITLIISINSFAQNAVKLNKGEVAPFTGALVKPDRLDKLVKAEKAEAVLRDLRVTHESIIKFHRKDAQRQREKLSEANFKNSIYNTGYFLLGVILASYAFKLQGEINR